MKYQKRSKGFRDLLNQTAQKTGQPIAEVDKVVEFYLSKVSQLIEWDNPVDIHIDYIGTLKWNQKWADKVKAIKDDNSNKV